MTKAIIERIEIFGIKSTVFLVCIECCIFLNFTLVKYDWNYTGICELNNLTRIDVRFWNDDSACYYG